MGEGKEAFPFFLKGFTMHVQHLVKNLVMFDETEVMVRLVRRDEGNAVIAHKLIPISYVKTNHDNMGIKIQIELADLKRIEWERV